MKEIKDYFTRWKINIVECSIVFTSLRESMIFMLEANRWLLEDINLCESFYHLQEMVEHSYQELTEMVGEIDAVERTSKIFYLNDLIDQFTYIKENINLEGIFILNILDYIQIIKDNRMESEEITDRFHQYATNDYTYLCQMKLNNKELKKLKKERRNSNE